MRMITGYINPTHGRIEVDGLSMADHPKKARRKIGYLPETPPLYPEMTVHAYLKFIADLRDVPAREQKNRIGEVIAKLGLEGRERQVIRGLSKGYRQRLGLAQAILHEPDLLILDEPTSGLDPKQIIEIRQLIRELGDKHTVLLSTHILPEINTLCNRVLIINQGRVVLDERPDNLGRTMGETFEVSLEVKGPREQILEQLQGIEAIATIKDLQPGSSSASEPAPEAVKLLVTASGGTDIREALFFSMAGAGYPILEMKRESLSLEDIFLKLTTDEPAANADSDSAISDSPTDKPEVDPDA
jgi:ABC-2 type transport system ATP-binding protein